MSEAFNQKFNEADIVEMISSLEADSASRVAALRVDGIQVAGPPLIVDAGNDLAKFSKLQDYNAYLINQCVKHGVKIAHVKKQAKQSKATAQIDSKPGQSLTEKVLKSRGVSSLAELHGAAIKEQTKQD